MNSEKNKEIDLYDVYLVLKKRYKLIVGTVFVFLFLTGIITYFERPVYRSSFTIMIPSVLNSDKSERKPIISLFEFKKIIDELNSVPTSKNSAEVVPEKIGIGTDKAGAQSRLTVVSRSKTDEFVEVLIDVSDPQPVNNQKNFILRVFTEHLINKTAYLQKKSQLLSEEFKASFKEMKEIRDIVFAQIKRDGPKYIGFDPLQLEQNMLSFKMRMIDIENEVRSLNQFEIIAESMVPQKVRPRILPNFVIIAIISLIIGILLSFIIEWFEKNAKTVL